MSSPSPSLLKAHTLSPPAHDSSRPLSVATTVREDSPEPSRPRQSMEKGKEPLSLNATDAGVIVVDWDGPDDPKNPRNWSTRRKWAATTVVSLFTFISPISSSMVAPAAAQLAEDLHIRNTIEIAMCISIFILGYAFGPLLLGPLSEIYGRSRVLQLANLWFLVWNLGCAFAQNKGQIIAFRLMAGLGGSAPLAVGGGVLADLFSPEQRGQAIAIYSLAPLLGPVVGPVAGAWIAQRSTWRWVFWSTTIFDAAIQVLGVFALQETYPPVLLEWKAARVRKDLAGAGDAEKGAPRTVRTVFDDGARGWRSVFKKALVRPFALAAHEPIIQLLGLYMAFIYGTIYLVLTTIPDIYSNIYHERTGVAGLHYIALGVGLTGASQLNARSMDRVYAYLARTRGGGVARPEFRLPSMVPGSVLLPAGMLIVGWCAQHHTHWIGPDIGLALVGAGMILNFQAITTYVIDAFTLHAASALAAVSVLRSLAGFGFPLFAGPMYKALGYGKGNTIIAVVSIAIGCPAPWLLWFYGERIRKASRHAK